MGWSARTFPAGWRPKIGPMSRPLAAAAWSVRTGPLRIWPGRAIFRAGWYWPVWAMLQRCDAAYYWSGRHTCRVACGSPPAGQTNRSGKHFMTRSKRP